MHAVVQVRYGSPDGLALREVARPVVGDDDVLVRVRAASVNAADWHLTKRLTRLLATLMGLPRTTGPGSDLAGQVEAAGKNVTRFQPGDEVFGGGYGSFAEYAASSESRLAPKPRNLSFEQAATIPLAGLTALQGLRDTARLQAGQSVVVYGAGGGVGVFAVQIAKALGAHVTAVSGTRNVDLLRALGADEVVDYTSEDFTRRASRCDVLFDLGANRSFRDCRRVLGPDGMHVLAGAPNGLGPILSRMVRAELLARIGRQRLGSFLARRNQEDLRALADLAEAGKLTPVIDRRYRLREVPDAIRYVGTRAARGKVVINVA
jgi:NADPH:quinone reductase-like Zn-dependent oxidoreductase